ncbi:MAG: hypothetical protein GY719_08535 [bacterium]|nr:hypothetical protein [bacterium]
MPDAYAPDLRGGTLGQEAISSSKGSLLDSEVAGLDIDGNDLSPVFGLDPRANLPLVDLVAERRDFLGRVST